MPLFNRSNPDEPRGPKTRHQIALSKEREEFLLKRAERREREFELFQRKVLLALAVPIGIAAAIGSLGDPELLKLAIGAASAWGAIAAALLRLGPKPAS